MDASQDTTSEAIRFESTVLSKTYGRPFALQKTLEGSGVAVSGYTCAHLQELEKRRQSKITYGKMFPVKERRVLAQVRRVAEAPLEGGGEEGGEGGPPMRKKRTRKEKDRHSAGSDFSGEGGGGGEGGGRRTRKQSCCSVCNKAGHYAKTVDGCKVCPKTNTPTAVDDVDSSSSSEMEVEGNRVHAPPRHQPLAYPLHPPVPPPPFEHGLPPQPPAFGQGLSPPPHVPPPPHPFPLPPHMHAKGHQHLPPPFYPPPPPLNISIHITGGSVGDISIHFNGHMNKNPNPPPPGPTEDI